MNQSQRSHTLIGYRHGQMTPGANHVIGSSHIDGVDVQHQLSICVQPALPIDIGRSRDGDLVWVSEIDDNLTPPSLPSLFIPQEPSTQQAPVAQEILDNDDSWLPFQDRLQVVGKYRKPIFFAAGAVVVIVAMGLLLPTSSATSDTSASSASSMQETSVPLATENPTAQDPETAAIAFVLKGEVEGVTPDKDDQASDFQATVVSQSGEIVLVDVLRNEESGLTTFATLLLQKSGTTWRIREVFDPRRT